MGPSDYPPARQRGISTHSILIMVLLVVTTAAAILASRQPIGLFLTVYILIGAVALFFAGLLSYRVYALTRANYSLDRERLVLKWGLRVEQIPIANIEWVRPPETLNSNPPMPFLRLPGSILGTRRDRDLGEVEYLASDASKLLFVATSQKVFAISPEAGSDFLNDVQRAIEMGSLTPADSQSVYPSFVVTQGWESPLARFLWLAGLLLNIGLLGWVSFLAPSLGAVSLGFLPSGEPRAASPGLWLILIPIVSIVFYLLGWGTGLALYRRPDRRPLAFILWSSGVISSLLFLLSVLFILTTPV
jgi:hypothetical protein